MVLTLDGNSEIGAHVWSEIGNLIRLERVQTQIKFLKNKVQISFKRAQDGLIYHLSV